MNNAELYIVNAGHTIGLLTDKCRRNFSTKHQRPEPCSNSNSRSKSSPPCPNSFKDEETASTTATGTEDICNCNNLKEQRPADNNCGEQHNTYCNSGSSRDRSSRQQNSNNTATGNLKSGSRRQHRKSGSPDQKSQIKGEGKRSPIDLARLSGEVPGCANAEKVKGDNFTLNRNKEEIEMDPNCPENRSSCKSSAPPNNQPKFPRRKSPRPENKGPLPLHCDKFGTTPWNEPDQDPRVQYPGQLIPGSKSTPHQRPASSQRSSSSSSGSGKKTSFTQYPKIDPPGMQQWEQSAPPDQQVSGGTFGRGYLTGPQQPQMQQPQMQQQQNFQPCLCENDGGAAANQWDANTCSAEDDPQQISYDPPQQIQNSGARRAPKPCFGPPGASSPSPPVPSSPNPSSNEQSLGSACSANGTIGSDACTCNEPPPCEPPPPPKPAYKKRPMKPFVTTDQLRQKIQGYIENRPDKVGILTPFRGYRDEIVREQVCCPDKLMPNPPDPCPPEPVDECAQWREQAVCDAEGNSQAQETGKCNSRSSNQQSLPQRRPSRKKSGKKEGNDGSCGVCSAPGGGSPTGTTYQDIEAMLDRANAPPSPVTLEGMPMDFSSNGYGAPSSQQRSSRSDPSNSSCSCCGGGDPGKSAGNGSVCSRSQSSSGGSRSQPSAGSNMGDHWEPSPSTRCESELDEAEEEDQQKLYKDHPMFGGPDPPAPRTMREEMQLYREHLSNIRRRYFSDMAEKVDDLEGMSPDIAAAMVYSEEIGYKMTMAPQKIYDYLYPEVPSQPIMPIGHVTSALPRGLDNIVVPLAPPMLLNAADYPGLEDPSMLDHPRMIQIMPALNLADDPIASDTMPPGDICELVTGNTMTDMKEILFPEYSNMEMFDDDEEEDTVDHEYDMVLNPAIPPHFPLIQTRGSQAPTWFPGYYLALPGKKDVKIENKIGHILERVWEEVQPEFVRPSGGATIIGE